MRVHWDLTPEDQHIFNDRLRIGHLGLIRLSAESDTRDYAAMLVREYDRKHGLALEPAASAYGHSLLLEYQDASFERSFTDEQH